MVFLLSTTKRLFKKRSKDDWFSVWMASSLYTRITHPKHRDCKPIDKIGAYISNIIKARSIDYDIKYNDEGILK